MPDVRFVPSERFHDAVAYAIRLHERQARKGGDTPYLTHLFSVAALVMEDGGGEDETIAALLHDAVEDQGGRATLNEIRARFGENVARIVEGCSDTIDPPKRPWKERKASYLAHLRDAPEDVRRVSLADKLHNSRSIVLDHELEGPSVWRRFNAGPREQLWYHRELLDAFRASGTRSRHLDLFARVVAELERRAAADA